MFANYSQGRNQTANLLPLAVRDRTSLLRLPDAPAELVACPRNARHWLINSRTAKFHFGQTFLEEYQDRRVVISPSLYIATDLPLVLQRG